MMSEPNEMMYVSHTLTKPTFDRLVAVQERMGLVSRSNTVALLLVKGMDAYEAECVAQKVQP